MTITLFLLGIIAHAALFAAMSWHPIFLWLARLVFFLDLIALAAYWHAISQSDKINQVYLLLAALGLLMAVLCGWVAP
jgi:uncharacterized membrane protein